MRIEARFDRFARQIRPTEHHIAEANRQTDYLVRQMKNRIAADQRFTLERILKAGSNAKFTSLRRTEENLFDVDLGAYFSGEGATREQLGKLLQFTHSQVRDIYGRTKEDDDFEILKSAVRVKFRGGIGLNVDIAPIIRDDSLGLDNGGWIPRPDSWRLTSVTCHNQFIHTRTARSNGLPGPVKFNRLVRLVKWWNNQQDDLVQPSIFCDLMVAAACEEGGMSDEWQSSFRQVFTFIRKHRFAEPIVFSDHYDPAKVNLPADDVVLLDPVNSGNNITKDWTQNTRNLYLDRVQETYDEVMQALSCELDGDEEGAIDRWSRVFGNAFRTLSEPEEGS